MLAARKVRWFERLFAWYCGRLLRRQFAGVRILGLERVQTALADGPVLLVANHVAFWDAVMIIWLSNQVLRADGYAWMEATNLHRLAFFRWLGAFGVRAQAAGDAAVAMRYARGLLRAPGQHIWLFPQGEERPASLRPLGFRGGSAVLMRHCPAAVLVPVALRYQYGETPRAWVHVTFGHAWRGPHQRRTHEAAVLAALQEQEEDLRLPRADARLFLVAPPPTPSWPTRLLSFLANRLMHTPLHINVQGAGAPAHPAPAEHPKPRQG